MSRKTYPAEISAQKFLEESFNRERDARLSWHFKAVQNSSQEPTQSRQTQVFRKKIEANQLRPTEEQLALLEKVQAKKKGVEKNGDVLIETGQKEHLEEAFAVEDKGDLQVDNSSQRTSGETTRSDMRPVDNGTRTKLYDGISREGRGRRQYLYSRYQIKPEGKFYAPLVSSWEYGWRLNDVIPTDDIQKPQFGRKGIVADTFYRRTGISTLHK